MDIQRKGKEKKEKGGREEEEEKMRGRKDSEMVG